MTAVSTGDAVIFEQGEPRDRQDTRGSTGFARLGGPNARPGASSRTLRYRGGSTADEPPLPGFVLIALALLAMLLGALNSSWAIPGLAGGTRPAFGRTGGP